MSKDQPVDEQPLSWQDVLEYYLGDYVWEHTPGECRQEAFRRTTEEAKEDEARLQAECNRAMEKFGIEKGVKYDVQKSDKVVVLTRTTPLNNKEQ